MATVQPIQNPGRSRLANSLWMLVALAASGPVHAVEVLTAAALKSHCTLLSANPESVDGQYCIRYIQGFIDGAVATDARVMLAAEAGQKETFLERASRTRAPNRTDRLRAARLAGFCLGDPLPLIEVVNRVVADLEAAPPEGDSGLSARDAVYRSLEFHYSCDGPGVKQKGRD